MDYKLSRAEFATLAYLHDNAETFDQFSAFQRPEIAAALAMEEREINRGASYLKNLGLVGEAIPTAVTFGSVNGGPLFLTAQGEHFMRSVEEEIESELNGIAKDRLDAGRITASVAGAIYETGRAIIVKVLADVMTGR